MRSTVRPDSLSGNHSRCREMRECGRMPDIPSRETLTALTHAVEAVRPSAIIGFSRHLEDGQIEMLYAYRFGIGAFVAPIAEVPEALRPFSRGIGLHDGFSATSQK